MKIRGGRHTRPSTSSAALLFGLALVASTSCIGARTVLGGGATPPSSVSSPSSDSYSALRQALGDAGFTVRDKGRSGGDETFGVPTRILSLDGAQVWVYEYPSEHALSAARAAISPDGYSVPTANGGVAIVEWVATPHFFSENNLLVLYLGKNQRVLNALERVLGPQVAGG